MTAATSNPSTPAATTQPALTVRPGSQRGVTRLPWLHSRHSFSFGHYFDPRNMGFRSLRVINDDIVAPGQGFGEHGHDNMEILTWVLDGALKHGDSLRHAQTLKPGELQVMTAGTGIRHSEFNASSDQPVRFLQIWIEPSEPNVQPRYLQQAFAAAARHNRWDTLASGRTDAPPAALPIHQDATLRVADLDPGASITLDMATGRHAYVHVARGGVTVLDQTLTDGDAFTTDTPGALTLTASAAGAQVLAFDLA